MLKSFSVSHWAGRQIECSFGKFLRRRRGAMARPIGAAVADVQVVQRFLFSTGRHRLQRLSLLQSGLSGTLKMCSHLLGLQNILVALSAQINVGPRHARVWLGNVVCGVGKIRHNRLQVLANKLLFKTSGLPSTKRKCLSASSNTPMHVTHWMEAGIRDTRPLSILQLQCETSCARHFESAD